MPSSIFKKVYHILYNGVDFDSKVILSLSLFFDISKNAVIDKIKYLGL